MAVQLVEDDVQGRKCHFSLKDKENVVGYGTIVSEGGPNVMLHNVPLGEGNFKLSVDAVLNEEAELPIPLKSGPKMMVDAVRTIVGWPKNLVTFPMTKKKEKDVPPVAIFETADEKTKFKEVENSLPMPCKFLYSYAVRLMAEEETIHVKFDEAMFGHNESTLLLREDVMRCMEMREIGSRHILLYMGYLYKYLKETNRAEYVSFVDPNKIPTCGVGQDGSSLLEHIANQLEQHALTAYALSIQHWVPLDLDCHK